METEIRSDVDKKISYLFMLHDLSLTDVYRNADLLSATKRNDDSLRSSHADAARDEPRHDEDAEEQRSAKAPDETSVVEETTTVERVTVSSLTTTIVVQTAAPSQPETRDPPSTNEARVRPIKQPKAVEWTMQYHPPSFEVTPRKERAKVVDGFIFNTELDQLEIRIRSLAPVVDYFVIVESNLTFQNTPKPLVFAENRERFAEFQNQIVYHAFLQAVDEAKNDVWAIGTAQHNAVGQFGIREVLMNQTGVTFAPNDLMILSDLDEMVAPDVVNWLAWHEGYTRVSLALSWRLYGYMWRNPNPWVPQMVTLFSILQSECFDAKGRPYANGGCGKTSRPLQLGNPVGNQPPSAGWHCSWCFPVSWYVNKMKSFTHSELDTERNRDYEFLRQCKLNGKWFTDKPGDVNIITHLSVTSDEFAPPGYEKNAWGHGKKWDYLFNANATGDEPMK